MPHIQSGAYYYLRHEHSGKYVCTGETANGGIVHLWAPIPAGHEPRYRFQVLEAGGSYVYLRHEYSGKYVCSGETANGGSVYLWGPIPAGHEPRYRFQIIVAGTGGGADYYVQHAYSEKYVCTGQTANLSPLFLWGPIPVGHEPRYRYRLTA